MPSGLAQAPLNVALFTADGAMDPAWQWYLYQVFTSAQAIEALQVLEAFDAASGNHAVELARKAAVSAAVGDAAPPIAGLLDGIRRQLATVSETPSTVRRLDSLEKLTWALAGGPPPRVILTGLDALRAATPAVDGTAWFSTDTAILWIAVAGMWVEVVGGGGGGLVLLESHTVSAASSIDFTSFISPSYDTYVIELSGILLSGPCKLGFRAGTGAGPTYDSSTSYSFGSGSIFSNGTGSLANGDTTDTLSILNSSDNSANPLFPISATIRLVLPASTTLYKNLYGQAVVLENTSSIPTTTLFGGYWLKTTPMTAMQFICSAPATATLSGTGRVYGISK